MINKLLLATGNSHKVFEIQAIFGNSLSVLSLKDLGYSGDIPEDQTTLEGNAREKAEWVFERYRLPCLADDTGLEVTALGGRPGVYSARYAGETDKAFQSEANIAKLLKEMSGITDRTARFRTVLAYVDPQGFIRFFEGIVCGEIADSPRGSAGFGYDAVFIPEGFTQSFAEMTPEGKNEISHRGKAIKAFAEWLQLFSQAGNRDI
ncbi:MAG: RdgB/HAM1 family non-canonical purine NTP pyrophosphatase [Bacteroidales bacterium]|nr:RdgB/HAM1 family non-canonical purine NTP pyrophosphatase [Bacteroidales bacterium]